jgi:hypothetical protein
MFERLPEHVNFSFKQYKPANRIIAGILEYMSLKALLDVKTCYMATKVSKIAAYGRTK